MSWAHVFDNKAILLLAEVNALAVRDKSRVRKRGEFLCLQLELLPLARCKPWHLFTNDLLQQNTALLCIDPFPNGSCPGVGLFGLNQDGSKARPDLQALQCFLRILSKQTKTMTIFVKPRLLLFDRRVPEAFDFCVGIKDA